MTFIISDLPMTDPGDAPYVPNLTRNLYMNFNAGMDAPNNNAVVENLTFRGNAPLLDRTFNKKRGSLLAYPVSVGGSDPHIQFDGGSAISNSNDPGGTGPYATISNNLTLAIRVKVNNWTPPSGDTAGFIRGVSARSAGIRYGTSGTEGSLRVSGGVIVSGSPAPSVILQTDVKTDIWATLIASYSDTLPTLFLAGNADPVATPLTAGTNIQGIGFGSAVNNAITAAAKFGMSHFAMWDRALTAEEMVLARDLWNNGMDIQS